jgi:alpha-glucosidase (family GH31 glycosyl hydrolase)
MNWSTAFANPGTWIKQISDVSGYNVKFMSWVAPCTFGTPVPPSGTYFNGGYYYLDLSNPAATAWYKGKLDSLQDNATIGVQGHKMDRCEESMSQVLSGTWADGTPTAEKQPKYLYLNAKVTDEALRAKWGDDQFNFPRGAYHRTQPYNGAVWAGDTRAPWPGLVGALANGIKTAFCGFPVWGSDIGGYGTGATKISTDQYMRWLTFGCFSGMMENMLDGKEPYIYTASGDAVDGQTFTVRYKSVCDLRMSLIPLIYSLANTSADNGVAMRPLPYMYPDDVNTYSLGDEYLLGDALLVAPITSAAMTRSVYLPAGTWYNFFNQAETHAAGTFTTPTIPLYQIPVYVKSNSVYVTGQIYPGNSKKWMTTYDAGRNLIINAFPGAAGESSTFTYVDYLDNDAKKVITVGSFANGIFRVKSPAMTVSDTVKVHMSTAPTSVMANNVALTTSQYAYTSATQSLSIPIGANQAIDVWINGVATGTVFEKQSLHGRLRIRTINGTIELIVPPASGLRGNSLIEAGILDMRGRQVWKAAVNANRICSTPCGIPMNGLSKGSYIATIKVDGLVAQRVKVVVP